MMYATVCPTASSSQLFITFGIPYLNQFFSVQCSTESMSPKLQAFLI